jgi:WhiB family redox-sensing transcriptional regulator
MTVRRVATRDLETDWRDRAACAKNPEPFDRVLRVRGSHRNTPSADIEAAVAICRTCPVTEACLLWALDNADTEGVWGATTTEQREAMRKSARNAERRDNRKAAS